MSPDDTYYIFETYTMAKEISEVSSGDIHNGQKDIRDIIRRDIQWSKIYQRYHQETYNGQKDIIGIIRRHIQWPKRYQRYHHETYTMAEKISEVSSGDIYNGQKDIRGIIRRDIQ
jgi:hypothetical protein